MSPVDTAEDSFTGNVSLVKPLGEIRKYFKAQLTLL